jgi:hypothetical protein
MLYWLAFESRKNPSVSAYGAVVEFDPPSDYPVAYCRPLEPNWAEWNFIIEPLVQRELIVYATQDVPGSQRRSVRITDKGWELFETRPRATGTAGFIAMKFHGMDDLHKAIQEGITRAGYKPTRIDREEYIGGVMDEIIAKVRESREARFVVADFTENRGACTTRPGSPSGSTCPCSRSVGRTTSIRAQITSTSTCST